MSVLSLLQFGPYRLDGVEGQLCRHDQVVHLPPKALAVLWKLASQAGHVVSKATLLDTVWADTVVSEGVLTACIRDLRQALGDDARRARYIETVHRRGYRFVAAVERLVVPLSPAAALPKLAPAQRPAGMVGREAEVEQLHTIFARARDGQRQVLFVAGEAGIGKTTLVEAYVASLERQETGWVGWGQCVEAYGPGTGYLPVLEALGRLCRGPHGATVIDHLRQWAPTWLAQLAGVLPPADHERLHRSTRGATRERRMRELAEVLEALTVMQPLVLVLEDLHWSDASTVDVLSMLAQRREAARLLVLGTYRPVELILRSHPLRQAVSELQLHGQCAELALRYLPPQAVAAYVAQRFPGHVSQAIAPVMYERTAGHPLFMVHLAEYLAQQVELDSGAGEQIETRTVAMVDTVPPGVQQLIELQLGRLRGDEQRVLEMASMAGAEFTVASVAAGVQMPLEHIEAVCADLLQRGPFLEVCGLALWPDGTLSGQYRFRHALYQQVLYRRLSDVQRVQGHRRVGVRLEAGYGARANEIAAELAVHFGRGRDPERAVGYHAQASQQALARFAYSEAIRHLSTGLELLETLPDTPVRMQHELTLRLALGMPLLVSKGVTAPEVEQTYTRAAALAQQLGDASQQYRALSGLHRIMMSRPDFQQASELAQQCLSLARGLCDPGMLLSAHHMLGVTLFNCGELLHARATLVDGLRQYQPPPTLAANYRDPRIDCRNYLAWALWLLGYADQALQQHAEAMALAQTQSSSHDLIFTMVHAAVQHHLRREAAATRAWAEQVLALATEQAYTSWMEYGLMYHGWALTVEGHGDSGLATLRQGLSDWQRRGTPFRQPYFLALLADACAQAGQTAAGLQAVVDALEIVNTTGERFYEAELYRLKGELLTQTGARNEAEACLHQALAVARRQQARSWELRAAISLSRLWQQQGKQDAARELLTAIYGWFTEGFETMDVQEAQALLAELSQGWCAARSKLVPRQHICPPSPPVRPTVPQSN